MTIHAAIVAAMADIAKTGIAKASRNKDQGYNFRGIEDAMNELSPILTRNGITVTPTYSDLQIAERQSKSGGTLRFVTIKGAFTFSAADGSSVVSSVYGEAMDSSDKATTKAQSVAFRTALFQQFVVPTMAMDPEDTTAIESQSLAEEVAMAMVEKFDLNNEWGAYEEWQGLTDNEAKMAVWSLLKPHSKLRSAIKRMGEDEKAGNGPSQANARASAAN